MLDNTTILTAVTPEYEKFLVCAIKTWRRNEQLKDTPMTLFTHGYRRPNKKFKGLWKDICVVKWNMNKYDSQRELMLSSFVLGVFQYTQTDFSLKIDSDVLVRENVPLLQKEDYNFDLVGNRWGYTKPKSFIIDIEEWSSKRKIFKSPMFDINEIKKKEGNTVGSKRINSFVCLQKKKFILECCSYLKEFRLPIPSHDTFLWYMAERLPHIKWNRRKFKPNVFSISNYRNFLEKFKEIVCEK